MGQQQSQEKSGRSSHNELQKKASRRASIQALSVGRSRGTPADPSSNNANATATTTTQHVDAPHLQSYLHRNSPSPEGTRSTMGRASSRRDKRQDPEDPMSTPPVPVPQSSTPMNVPSSRSKPEDLETKTSGKPSDTEASGYDTNRYVPPSQMRPPRFPLPIAESEPIPDSPILDPVDKGNQDLPIFDADEPVSATESPLRRKSSMLSTVTDDEDDPGHELPEIEPGGKKVLTTIEYNHVGAQRVYVTGTFTNWEKKYRMHHKPDGSGWYTKVDLPPGTHHMMFLVDDRMTVDSTLPQTVDFNSVLLNFIEIAHEDVYKARRESTQTTSDKRDSLQAVQQVPVPEEPQTPDEEDTESAEAEQFPPAEEIALGDFRPIIPTALVHIDSLPEEDPRYNQALRIISECQGPPALPTFINKSILNMNAPVKDDNSVLVLPNHTVLNHLMTSSVKNGVLATSVTTRYRKKYVTTISFKPVPKAKPQTAAVS